MSGQSVICDHIYGKDAVKVLYVKREGNFHSIRELEVSTKLKLNNIKDYITGDNSDIVATDTQKNTVYILAKKFGISSPEQFALVMCEHFLSTYSHVIKARVHISERPWTRMQSDRGQKHNHAFVSIPDAIRSTTVTRSRGDKLPLVETTLDGLRVLKTTKSSFVNFYTDDYRSLPDAPDRIFSTVIRAKWTYDHPQNTDFDGVAEAVKRILFSNFAGEYPDGTNSPSVQNTMYLSGKEALDTLPSLARIELEMPNVHYLTADFSKFPRLIQGQNLEVFVPTDKPAGNIFVEMSRDKVVSKL